VASDWVASGWVASVSNKLRSVPGMYGGAAMQSETGCFGRGAWLDEKSRLATGASGGLGRHSRPLRFKFGVRLCATRGSPGALRETAAPVAGVGG
jgi:hypothetical protein